MNINTNVLSSVANRLAAGLPDSEVFQTEEEKKCRNIIKDLSHVDGKVAGSLTSKCYMKSEIWSMIYDKGAPTWYITLSPADHNSPISLYYAGTDQTFEPKSLSLSKRTRIIANNPVVAARYFHYTIKAFLECVLGVDSKSDGLFGKQGGYYGVVEQQGRLTLHLHMVLCIQGSWRPQEIRDRVLSDEGEFVQRLIAYLELLHEAEVKTDSHAHLYTTHKDTKDDQNYINPLETLPLPPPPKCKAHTEAMDGCEWCLAISTWMNHFYKDTDDIAVEVNTHVCRSTLTKAGNWSEKYDFTSCLDNKYGVCKARFPRDVLKESVVDQESGAVLTKHIEPYMNKYNRAISYLIRSNIDVCSLMSGTAIRGVIFYVCDYITKSPLKTHVIFSVIQSVFMKNSEMLTEPTSDTIKAKKLVTQIVNALAAKAEYGAPMINSYLLGFPDHYTDQKFVSFYWNNYVSEARSVWLKDNNENKKKERIVLSSVKGKVVNMSKVYDYIYRPEEFTDMCLYDWVHFYDRERLYSKQTNDSKKTKKGSIFKFLPDHPLSATHGVKIFTAKNARIPNFTGTPLPRRDAGDMDYYACSMLTLFKPWRSGQSLKTEKQNWQEAFDDHKFSVRQNQLMDNFQIRYECLDGRDVFHAQMKARAANQSIPAYLLNSAEGELANDDSYLDQFETNAFASADYDEIPEEHFSNTYRNLVEDVNKYRLSLEEHQWTTPFPSIDIENFDGDIQGMYKTNWKDVVNAKRVEVSNERMNIRKTVTICLCPST